MMQLEDGVEFVDGEQSKGNALGTLLGLALWAAGSKK